MDSLVCPSCKTSPNRDARIAIDRPPREGDYVLCLHCGEVSIFSDERANLRVPNHAETRDIEIDNELKAYRDAWRLGVLKY